MSERDEMLALLVEARELLTRNGVPDDAPTCKRIDALLAKTGPHFHNCTFSSGTVTEATLWGPAPSAAATYWECQFCHAVMPLSALHVCGDHYSLTAQVRRSTPE